MNLNCEGGRVGFLKGMLFNSLKYNCEGGSAGFLKGSLFIYLKLNYKERIVGLLKDRYLSIWSNIVREEL